jgi:ABC-type amino acid transport substrate-binding protein
MTGVRTITQLMLVVGALAVGAAEPKKAACQLSVAYDRAEPFHYLDADGKLIGSDVEILTAAMAGPGCALTFTEYPWARTLKRLAAGESDVGIGAGYNEERTAWAWYSASYRSIQHWLYTATDKHQAIASVGALLESGATLAVVIAWKYPEGIRLALDNPAYKSQIVTVAVFEQLPQMLASGRVDAIIANPLVLAAERKKHGITAAFSPRAKYEEPLYFLFAKKSVPPAVVTEFNNRLFHLIAIGQRAAILAKHGVTTDD